MSAGWRSFWVAAVALLLAVAVQGQSENFRDKVRDKIRSSGSLSSSSEDGGRPRTSSFSGVDAGAEDERISGRRQRIRDSFRISRDDQIRSKVDGAEKARKRKFEERTQRIVAKVAKEDVEEDNEDTAAAPKRLAGENAGRPSISAKQADDEEEDVNAEAGSTADDKEDDKEGSTAAAVEYAALEAKAASLAKPAPAAAPLSTAGGSVLSSGVRTGIGGFKEPPAAHWGQERTQDNDDRAPPSEAAAGNVPQRKGGRPDIHPDMGHAATVKRSQEETKALLEEMARKNRAEPPMLEGKIDGIVEAMAFVSRLGKPEQEAISGEIEAIFQRAKMLSKELPILTVHATTPAPVQPAAASAATKPAAAAAPSAASSTASGTAGAAATATSGAASASSAAASPGSSDGNGAVATQGAAVQAKVDNGGGAGAMTSPERRVPGATQSGTQAVERKAGAGGAGGGDGTTGGKEQDWN